MCVHGGGCAGAKKEVNQNTGAMGAARRRNGCGITEDDIGCGRSETRALHVNANVRNSVPKGGGGGSRTVDARNDGGIGNLKIFLSREIPPPLPEKVDCLKSSSVGTYEEGVFPLHRAPPPRHSELPLSPFAPLRGLAGSSPFASFPQLLPSTRFSRLGVLFATPVSFLPQPPIGELSIADANGIAVILNRSSTLFYDPYPTLATAGIKYFRFEFPFPPPI